MTQKPIATIRPVLPAGNITPSPPSGQALGQYGINIMHPRKHSNPLTKNLQPCVYVRTTVAVRDGGLFDVLVKTPSNTLPSMKAAGTNKGSSMPKKVRPFLYSHETHHSAQLKARDRFPHHPGPSRLRKPSPGSAKPTGLTVPSPS